MKTALIAIAAVALIGCAAVQDTIRPARTPEESAQRAQLALEREQQRQFERCMNLTLGKFASFQSPDARIKAAEACKTKPQP